MSELKFIETTDETIYTDILEELENGVGEPLYPGDERRIFGDTMAKVIVTVYNTVNDACRQKMLRYARGTVLDALGENRDVIRLDPTYATTTLRFTVTEAVGSNIIIPAGLRVTGDFVHYFLTDTTAVLYAGSLYVDVAATAEEAADRLDELIRDLGGMDIFLLSSGIGNQNKYLDTSIEQATIQTNVTGFTRMVLAAYRYFSSQGGGHISVISSIAGTKGLGVAPSYSATKRYQNIYIDALAQLSRMEKQPITFTDIRPGFVRTDLLKDGRNYPMLMSPQYAALRIANAIDRKKRRAIIDWKYAILVFLWRLIPEWLWERLPIRN